MTPRRGRRHEPGPAPLLICGGASGAGFLALGLVVTSWARLVSFAASAAILAVMVWFARRIARLRTPDDVRDLDELRRAFAREADGVDAADVQSAAAELPSSHRQ